MATYEPLDDEVEINGRTILAMVDGVSRFSDEYRESVRESLRENGVVDPTPGEWYPQDAWLDAFAELADDLEPHLLDRIGEQIPDAADWPGGISGVAEGLESIDEAYHRNHRGGEIGHYRVAAVEDATARVVCDDPYPCPFDRGIIRSVARRYSPVEAFVFVEESGDQCREDGGERCEYTVHW